MALNDYGCSLKVYRAAMIKKIRLFGEMHRFIPVGGDRDQPLAHQRDRGWPSGACRRRIKYGISRTFRVLLDLLAMYFFLRYRARPGALLRQYRSGAGCFVGSFIMMYLMVVRKFGMGESIGERPLLLVGILCLIASAQFLTTGVLSELLAHLLRVQRQAGLFARRRRQRSRPNGTRHEQPVRRHRGSSSRSAPCGPGDDRGAARAPAAVCRCRRLACIARW